MKKIFNTLAFGMLVLSLSSCLKGTNLVSPDSPNSAGAIIEFENPTYIDASTGTATVATSRYTITLTASTAAKVHVNVQYVGTGKAAPSDVVVNLTTDAAAIATHNTQAGRTAANSFVAIPAAAYTMPATVTIPSGQTKVGFDITLNTNLYPTTLGVIALKIGSASVGTISGNFGTILLYLPHN